MLVARVLGSFVALTKPLVNVHRRNDTALPNDREQFERVLITARACLEAVSSNRVVVMIRLVNFETIRVARQIASFLKMQKSYFNSEFKLCF